MIVRGFLLVLLSFANLQLIWSPDVLPNTLLAWTLLRSGDLNFDEFTVAAGTSPSRSPGPERADQLDRETYFFRACGRSTASEAPKVPRSAGGPPAAGPNDHICSIFPPGMAFLALPVFAPAVLAGVPPSDTPTLFYLGHLAAAIVEAIATLLLLSIMRRFVGRRSAFLLALLYALGTSVRTVASQALWQHAGVHLFLSLALWLVLREEPVSLARQLVAGLALGLAGVVRQTAALAVVGLAGLRRLPLVALAAGVGLAPLLVYNAVAFGNAFEQGYGAKPFDTPIAAGLYGLIASPSRGLLVYEPYAAFALVALGLAWRRDGQVARRLRVLGLVWIASLVLYASYAEWWGGRVFGPRFLDDQAPILFAALAWGIGRAGLVSTRWHRIVFGLLALWSLVLFNAAALVYDLRWDTAPLNVNVHPERLLDWSDPQWLAVIASLPSGGARAATGLVLSLLTIGVLLRLEGVTIRRSPSVATHADRPGTGH